MSFSFTFNPNQGPGINENLGVDLNALKAQFKNLRAQLPFNVYAEEAFEILLSSLRKIEGLESTILEKAQAIFIVDMLEGAVVANTVRLAINRSLALAADINQKIHILGLIIVQLSFVGGIYFAAKTAMSGARMVKALSEGESVEETLRSHGLDTLNNALWYVAISASFGVAGTVAVPIGLAAFAVDIVVARVRLCEKESKLKKKMDASDFKTQSPEYKNAAERLHQHYQQARRLNTAVASVFFVNSTLLASVQACAAFGLLGAAAAVAWPLTIACLSLAVVLTLAYAAYRYGHEKPKAEKLEQELDAAEAKVTEGNAVEDTSTKNNSKQGITLRN